MIRRLVDSALRYFALEQGRFVGLYTKLCRPTGSEYALYLQRWGGLRGVGGNCSINVGVRITDPAYVLIGNSCVLADCTLIGHDAVVHIIQSVYGCKTDSVGKIVIKDNCFVGHGAILMPGVTIGPNAVVGAGAVVTRDVLAGMVVAGVPAKVVCTLDSLAARVEARSRAYPWHHMIEQRAGSFDPAVEPELVRQRLKFFFGEDTH